MERPALFISSFTHRRFQGDLPYVLWTGQWSVFSVIPAKTRELERVNAAPQFHSRLKNLSFL